MPGFLEPIWEAVFKVATWSALVFGALSVGSAFVSAWVGWQITDATQRDANSKIKAADERIAEYQAVAATAQLEIQKLKNRRHLTVDEMQRLTDALRPHAGKHFGLTVAQGDDDPNSEQKSFARQLEAAFENAGWTITKHASLDPTQIESERAPLNQRGCNVASAPDGKSLAVKADVLKALKNVGVECEANAWVGMIPEVICIDVGFW